MKRLGLALGSGGVRGLAHVGVIRALEKHKIPVSFIAGASAGSLVGGLYSIEGSANKLEEYLNRIDFLTAGKKYVYFLEFRRMFYKLEEILGEKKIEEGKIPFVAVATNLENGEPYIFRKGLLSQAIASSVAIPFILPSVSKTGKRLVDGGASMPIPVAVIKKETEVVVAVNLYKRLFPFEENMKVFGKLNVLYEAAYSILKNLALENERQADVVIKPDYLSVSLTSNENVKAMIDSGFDACEAKIPEIKKLLEL